MKPKQFTLQILWMSFITLVKVSCDTEAPYYGVRIGKLITHFHEVKGEVYSVDDKTIFIKEFTYDGRGPDAFFWAGTSVRPDSSGFVIPDEKGSSDGLVSYHGQDIVLRLPEGKEVTQLRWLSVWSKSLNVNFGSLIFPKNIEPPRPVAIGRLESTSHGVSSGLITVLDTQTFLVSDFTYDGTGKGVFWWLSRGLKPNTGGIKLRDENGSEFPLKKYSGKTVVISVPDGYTVQDYDMLSIWSQNDFKDYGFVRLPRDLRIPPSPRKLGISLTNKLNCELLNDDLGFEVRWVINNNQLIMQLVSKIARDEYMAFGLSSDDTETKFTSADAAIAWLGPNGQGHVVDYFFLSTDKCVNGSGMCPDSVYEDASNSLTLMNTAEVNNYVMITFSRSLKAADKKYDQHVYTDGPQAVLWAVGPVLENDEIGTPRMRTRGNLLLDFGREPMWNCPSPDNEMTMSMALKTDDVVVAEQTVAHVNCPTDLTFRAQLGRSNHPEDSPDRIWYINGLPAPILTIQRGQLYTFLVEGGRDPPLHHPFYITSSKEGALYQKVLDKKEHEEIVFAGVTQDPTTGGLLPTAEGRLCEWSSSPSSFEKEKTEDFAAVSSDFPGNNVPTLELSCAPGSAGKLQWLPDANTSDIVYYQSFTQKNMGGTIRVVDWCEETDPEGYLIESGNQRKPHSGPGEPESELEREGDTMETDETRQTETSEAEDRIYGNFHPLQEQHNSSQEDETEERLHLPGEEILEDKIVNLQRGSQEKRKLVDFLRNGQQEFVADGIASEEQVYSQDDAETVDIMRLNPINMFESHHPINTEERIMQRKEFIETQSTQNRPTNKPRYKPQQFKDETRVSKPIGNVHFEGGFVPLLRNTHKEREFTDPPHFLSNQRDAPQRPFPFDANESVPFHGTFKPGVPDFSGFNISHYTNAPDILPQNHHNPEQYQGLQSVPKPHLVQRPVQAGRPHNVFLRPQRPFAKPAYLFNHNPHSFQSQRLQNQHIFAQLPVKHRPEVHHSSAEDLVAGSSQRVQVALQNPENEKTRDESFHRIPNSDVNIMSNGVPVKFVAAAPAIQRRPDFVEENEEQLMPQGRPPYNKYQPQQHPNNEVPQNKGPQNNGPHGFIAQMHPQRSPHPHRAPHPLRRPIQMSYRPHMNIQRFPTDVNAMPHFMKRPESAGITQNANLHTRPVAFHGQPIPIRSQLPPRGSSEHIVLDEVKQFQPQKFNSIPSLETVADKQNIDEIVPLPSRENFGQQLQNRPQPIPAPSPSKIPSETFIQRPLNQQPQYNAEPNGFLQAPTSHEISRPHEQVVSAHRTTLKPDVVPPSVPQYVEEELQIGESQDWAVEVPTKVMPQKKESIQESSNDNINLFTDQPGTATEVSIVDSIISGASSVLNPFFNPEHAFENFDLVPGLYEESLGEDYTIGSSPVSQGDSPIETIITDISEGQNDRHLFLNLPEQYVGGDVPIDGQESQLQNEVPEKDEEHFIAPSNRPTFFTVRRQPQFSSVYLLDDEQRDVTTDPIQRVKITAQPSPPINAGGWPGRKNILNSDGANNALKKVEDTTTSKNLEEIHLPQVLERPDSHDNGTDYSILAHVLSLIGKSPDPMDVIEPRTAT